MNRLIINMIRMYQKGFPNRPQRCKYHPSCSNYCLHSFQKFGFLKAAALSVWRILRCNPFSKGGYDPVPPDRIEKLFKNDYKYP